MQTTEVINKYKKLLSERPNFHAHYENEKVLQSEVFNWAISPEVLDWLMEHLEPDMKTLETGCGYTTVVFSMLRTEHVVISPFAEEHEAIKRWCERHEIMADRTQWVARASQDAIATLQNGPPLDLVLVDGDHAFPVPFMDWYYTAERVKKGGYLLIDDTQLITGTILRDFLERERERWRLVVEIGKTVIFQKETTEPVVRGLQFRRQPFCAPRERNLVRRIRRKLGRLLVHRDDALWWQ
jgi:predicted O-methyltransferase YrrM